MRNYTAEYKSYHSKPAQKKNRAGRNAARAKMTALGRTRKGDGKDVDHKNGNPRDNRTANLSVMARRRNRSKK
jgi:hypothetical protein